MNMRRQNILGRGHSTCKGPEVGTGLLCSRLARSRVGEAMGPSSRGEDCQAE